MHRTTALITGIVLAVCGGLGLASSPAAAGEEVKVYRWVDEDGNYQYGDKKMKEDAEDTGLRSKTTDPEDVKRRAERREQEIKKLEAKEGMEERSEARDEAWRKEQERRCERARQWQQKVSTQPRLYTTDDQGNRNILDTEKRQEMEAEARRMVEKECGPLEDG